MHTSKCVQKHNITYCDTKRTKNKRTNSDSKQEQETKKIKVKRKYISGIIKTLKNQAKSNKSVVPEPAWKAGIAPEGILSNLEYNSIHAEDRRCVAYVMYYQKSACIIKNRHPRST